MYPCTLPRGKLKLCIVGLIVARRCLMDILVSRTFIDFISSARVFFPILVSFFLPPESSPWGLQFLLTCFHQHLLTMIFFLEHAPLTGSLQSRRGLLPQSCKLGKTKREIRLFSLPVTFSSIAVVRGVLMICRQSNKWLVRQHIASNRDEMQPRYDFDVCLLTCDEINFFQTNYFQTNFFQTN